MREIQCEEISETIKQLCIKACCVQTPDIKNAFKKAQEIEQSAIGKSILGTLIKNGEIAQNNMMPICQDTGMTVIFAEIGQDIHIVGGLFSDAVNEGVRRGYKDGYLRKSVVNEPLFERKNTTDNAPAVLHTEIVSGDKIKITDDMNEYIAPELAPWSPSLDHFVTQSLRQTSRTGFLNFIGPIEETLPRSIAGYCS